MNYSFVICSDGFDHIRQSIRSNLKLNIYLNQIQFRQYLKVCANSLLILFTIGGPSYVNAV